MNKNMETNNYFTSTEISDILSFLNLIDANSSIQHFAISREEVINVLNFPLSLYLDDVDDERSKLLIVDLLNIYVSIKYHLLVKNDVGKETLLEEKVLYGDYFSGRFTKKMANEKRYDDLSYWLDKMADLEIELVELSKENADIQAKIKITLQHLTQAYMKRLGVQQDQNYEKHLNDLQKKLEI